MAAVVTVSVPGPKGPQGTPGPPNTLTIGTVTSGTAGSNPSATITGLSPNQVLNLTIPSAPSDLAAGTASMRTLGTGATQAAAGDHTHSDLTNATANLTGSTLAKRDADGGFSVTWLSIGGPPDIWAAPTAAQHGTRKDYVDGKTWLSTAISDSTTTGRSVITAADAAAARTAIGAGTSSLVTGTTAGTAAAGNDTRLSDARTPTTHTHPVGDLTATGTKSTTTFLRGDNTWATPPGGTVTASQITDSTAVGRSVLTATDAAAARTAIAAGTSSLALGTTGTTAKAGNYQPASANISDSTAVGRSVLTSVDAAAARTAIGAGTGNGNVTGTGISTMTKITQLAYDALGTKDPATLYVIVG